MKSPPQPRGTTDTLCKRLAEEYPTQFAQWLFGATGQVEIVKTEISREPVRADSVIFSHDKNETLHIEFQTTMKTEVPMPLRLLDYYVGFKRQNPDRRVRQALVVLKPTNEEIPDRYKDERTLHSYDVIKMWDQEPEVFLKHEGLLPLATLCRAESGEKLLNQVAVEINHLKSHEQRGEVLNWARVLAGLRYNKAMVYQVLRGGDMLEESVVYQDIFQKGEKRGKQSGLLQGVELGERRVAMRQLERRFGRLPITVQRQIEKLVAEQLEALCDELLDFKSKDDLTLWLKEHAPKRRSRT